MSSNLWYLNILKDIVSKSALKYIEEMNIEFSDAELSTIVYHSILPLCKKHHLLKCIQNATKDDILRQQVKERIEYEHKCYRLFSENDGSCFYQVSINGESIGNFSSIDGAISYAKAINETFTISKYQIISLCKNIIVPQFIENPRLFDNCTIHGRGYAGDPISEWSYGTYGIKSFWSYEVTAEEYAVVEDWGKCRFEHKFIEFPNPFDADDMVKKLGCDKIGVIRTSQAEWKRFLNRAKESEIVVDFIDASIIVEFNDGTHEHIPPIYLEKIEYVEGESRCRKTENL